MGDAGKIEWSFNIFSWDPNACALSLLSCKSGVWSQCDIRKSPLLKEAICFRKLMEHVEYYLAQSECNDNMVLTDASCLQFISRFKDYIVRWQTLEMTDFIGHFFVGVLRPISQQDPLTDHSSKTFQPKKKKSDRASGLAQFFCKTWFFKGKRPKISKNRPTSTVICG